MQAYCMKCKTQRDVNNVEETVNTRGLRMLKGQCSICGTNVSKILGKK